MKTKILLILGLLMCSACTTKNNSLSNAPGGTDGQHPVSVGGNQDTQGTASPSPTAAQ
jgi:hypothetical protein